MCWINILAAHSITVYLWVIQFYATYRAVLMWINSIKNSILSYRCVLFICIYSLLWSALSRTFLLFELVVPLNNQSSIRMSPKINSDLKRLTNSEYYLYVEFSAHPPRNIRLIVVYFSPTYPLRSGSIFNRQNNFSALPIYLYLVVMISWFYFDSVHL